MTAMMTPARFQALIILTVKHDVQPLKTQCPVCGDAASASSHSTNGQRYEYTCAQHRQTSHLTVDTARALSPMRMTYEIMLEHIRTTACSNVATAGAGLQAQRR